MTPKLGQAVHYVDKHSVCVDASIIQIHDPAKVDLELVQDPADQKRKFNKRFEMPYDPLIEAADGVPEHKTWHFAEEHEETENAKA